MTVEPQHSGAGTASAGDPETIPEMFTLRVQRDPDETFLLAPDRRTWTYSQLAGLGAALRQHLLEAAVGPGDVVGLYLWNDPAWFVTTLAAWSIGAVPALCGAVSPAAEAMRRFQLVRPALVVAADDADQLPGWPIIRVNDEGRRSGAGTPPTPDGRELLAPPLPSPDDPACVFFTSGTTGDAKAVVKLHGPLAAAPRRTAEAYARTVAFRPRVARPGLAPALSFNPFGQSASFGRLVFRLYVGRTLVMMRKFDVETVARLAETYRLDTLQLTPAMLHMLAFTDRAVDLSSLKYVNSGTAPLPVATRDAFELRYGVPVLQAYGSTEGGVTALEHLEDVRAGRRGPGSVGRITSDSEWRIVDVEGRDVAPGEEGELLGRPQQRQLLTAEGEDALPVDAGGWYHTGDLARVDEHGVLYITGRLKEMMIVGGFNVFPGEVEDVLRRSELVEDTVVVPVPDDRLGEIPAAGLVLKPPARETGDARTLVTEVAARARRELAPYKVPRRWFLLDALPITPNSKLDRQGATARAEREAVPIEDLPTGPPAGESGRTR